MARGQYARVERESQESRQAKQSDAPSPLPAQRLFLRPPVHHTTCANVVYISHLYLPSQSVLPSPYYTVFSPFASYLSLFWFPRTFLLHFGFSLSFSVTSSPSPPLSSPIVRWLRLISQCLAHARTQQPRCLLNAGLVAPAYFGQAIPCPAPPARKAARSSFVLLHTE